MPSDHVSRPKIKSRSKSNHQGTWENRGHSASERQNYFHPDGVPDYGGMGGMYRDYSAPERSRPNSMLAEDWHLQMSAMALEMSAIARQCIQDTMKEIREQALNIQVHVVPRTVSEQGIQFPEPVQDQQCQTSLIFASPPKGAVPKSCTATQTEGEYIFVPRTWLPNDIQVKLEKQEAAKGVKPKVADKKAGRRAWLARALPDLDFVNRHKTTTQTALKTDATNDIKNSGTSPESGLLVRFERSSSSPAKFENVARVQPTYCSPLRRVQSDPTSKQKAQRDARLGGAPCKKVSSMIRGTMLKKNITN
jgi:hypothetical protein